MTGLRVTADKDTGVAVVTLDRPHRLNAIDLGLRDELIAAWRELRFDDTVRAVVLTGAGERAFCTGLDRDAEVPQPNSPTWRMIRSSTSARNPTTSGNRSSPP